LIAFMIPSDVVPSHDMLVHADNLMDNGRPPDRPSHCSMSWIWAGILLGEVMCSVRVAHSDGVLHAISRQALQTAPRSSGLCPAHEEWMSSSPAEKLGLKYVKTSETTSGGSRRTKGL
jgi:hypothetical protein